MSKRDISQAIIAAALDLSSNANLHQISQAKIAKHAGVSQSHLTYYFPKRSELIKAALNRMADELFEDLSIVDATLSVEELHQNFKQRCLADVSNKSRAWLMISAMEASQVDEELKHWFKAFEKQLYEHFEQTLLRFGFNTSQPENSILFMSIVGLSVLNIHLIDDKRLAQYTEHLGLLIDELMIRSKS